MPNPTHGPLELVIISESAQKVNIGVLDVMGRQIKEELEWKTDSGENRIPLLLDDLTEGIYLLEIQTSDGVLVRKVQIVK